MAKIAIADDSTPIRLLLRRRLEGAGHEVVEAADGEDLVELIETECEGRVDLALIDWMMPGLDGAGTTELIRERWPDTPVIGFTAGLPSEASGAPDSTDAFVAKPFDFDHLFEAIEALTGGRPRP